MKQLRQRTIRTDIQSAHWTTQARILHWLAALSLLGATALSSQSDIVHAALGFVAMGALFIQLIGDSKAHVINPALWLVTMTVFILALSGILAPHGNFHLGTTLAALVMASLYCATVLFESLRYINADKPGLASIQGR